MEETIKIAGKSYPAQKVLSALRTMSEQDGYASERDRLKGIMHDAPYSFYPKEDSNSAKCISRMIHYLNKAERTRLFEMLDRESD